MERSPLLDIFGNQHAHSQVLEDAISKLPTLDLQHWLVSVILQSSFWSGPSICSSLRSPFLRYIGSLERPCESLWDNSDNPGARISHLGNTLTSKGALMILACHIFSLSLSLLPAWKSESLAAASCCKTYSCSEPFPISAAQVLMSLFRVPVMLSVCGTGPKPPPSYCHSDCLDYC